MTEPMFDIEGKTVDPELGEYWETYVYFKPDEIDKASMLQRKISVNFFITPSPIVTNPKGIHPTGQFKIQVDKFNLRAFLPWLTENRNGFTVLSVPKTSNDIKNHIDNAVWMGEPIRLNLE